MNKQWIAFHLQEALEQLQQTLSEMTASSYGESELRFDMQHAYHHLNTAWNSRAVTDQQTSDASAHDFHLWRRFPSDLDMAYRTR